MHERSIAFFADCLRRPKRRQQYRLKGRMDMVTVTIHGKTREVSQGITLEELAADYQQEYDCMIAAASIDRKSVV